jgi:hypothetical protein
MTQPFGAPVPKPRWAPYTEVLMVSPARHAVMHRVDTEEEGASKATCCWWVPATSHTYRLDYAMDLFEPFACIRCFELPRPVVI